MLKGMAVGDNNRYDPSPYLAVLDEFEREGKLRSRQAWITVLAIFGVVLLVAAILHRAGIFPQPWWLYPVIAGIGLLLAWLSKRQQPAMLWRYYSKCLPGSGLAERLARGEFRDDPLHKHLGWPLNRLLRPVGSQDYRAQLWRIANNIHWHVKPPALFTPISVLAVPPVIAMLVFALLVEFLTLGADPFANAFAAIIVLASAGMLAIAYFSGLEYVQPLADYLRASWSETATGIQHAPVTESSALPPGLLINRLSDDLDRALAIMGCLPNMLAVVLIVSALSIIDVALSTAFAYEPLGWPLMAAGLLLLFLLAAILRRFQQDVEAETAKWLIRSDLAARITTGEIDRMVIEQYVPRPFRFCVRWPRIPRSYDDEFSKTAWRVAFNLDWYRGRPRRLLRARWVGWLTLIMLLPIVIAIVALFDLPLIDQLGVGLVLAVLAVLAYLGFRDSLRASAWARAFVVHLRERIGDDGGAQDKP
jgi:hypothetical protein